MLDAVTKGYLMLHPASAARTLSRIDKRDAASAFSAMPRQLAGQVLEAMAPASAARCLAVMQPGLAGDILARAPRPTAVAALRLMDREQAQELLTHLPRPKAARLKLQLRFSEWVIGALVDDDVLTLSPDHLVGDALRLYRSNGQRTGQIVTVIDSERRLAGVVDLCDLLRNPDRRPFRQLMQPAVYVVSTRAALLSVVDHPAWLTHDNLPVINRNGIFQGVLRRSRVAQEETAPVSEVVERNEQVTTRAALADIFWLAIGALITGGGRPDDNRKRDV